MLRNTPLVPSKDALRVLRRLAYAGSTLAAIGVVTLNYSVHCRVRLAEQRLETKKQIRALSNGKGKVYMDRVFQAAEDGQDFTIRAMREQRNRERRLSSPLVEGLGEKKLDNLWINGPNEARVAQTVKKATVTITSTAHAHAYGHPKRFTRPTPSWPRIKTEETQVTEVPIRVSNNKALFPNTAEAAEKIKRATMAMTSTAPAHVYGRPKKVLLKFRPSLHDPVASWLHAASESQTSTDAAPPLIDLQSTSIAAETRSRQTKTATALNMEPVGHGPSIALHHIERGAAGHHDGLDIANFAEVFPATPIAQHCREQHTITPSQTISSTGLNRGPPIRPGDGRLSISTGHVIPLVGTNRTPRTVADKQQIPDARKIHSHTASTVLSSVEVAGVGTKRVAAAALSHELNSQNSKIGNVTTVLLPVTRAQAGQSVVEQATPSTNLQPREGGKTRDNGSVDRSAIRDGTLTKSTIYDNHAASTLQPCQNIQLEVKANKAGQPGFIQWPHLQPLDGSPSFNEQEEDLRSVGGEKSENRLGEAQEGTDALGKEGRNEQQQTICKWTPFPRTSRAPERTTSHLHLQQNIIPVPTSSPIHSPEQVHQSEDRLATSSEEKNAESVMTAEERVRLALHIKCAFSRDGLSEGQRAWKAAVHLRLVANDFATVDFLYREFVEKGVMDISPRHQLIQSLVQWHYGRSKYSARAAEILFPELQTGQGDCTDDASSLLERISSLYKRDRQNSVFAIRFLQGLWETSVDPGWLLLNFRRVIVAAKLRGVKLVEELFAVVIRFLASTGDMTNAQAVYDEMVFYHQITATFHSRALLLRGFARIGDWQRVEREIESLHNHGLSRSRPHGYALMVDAVLQEHANRSSIEHFQNFIIKAISYWGLVPTSSISITTVQTYLSQRRYDLVREWMETLQVLFPQLETETGSFLWHLGESWQRMSASCHDIEATMRAVAYRNPRTKLKPFSVPMIQEALSRDLGAKLDAVRSKIDRTGQSSPSSATEGQDFTSTKDFDAYLSSAFSLAESAVSQNHRPIPEALDLHRQASAAQRLHSFLTNPNSTEDVDRFCFPSSFESDPSTTNTRTNITVYRGPAPGTSTISHLGDSVPKILTTEFLPATKTITAAILEFYRTRSMRNLSTDHALFSWVCEKLLHADRAFDAVFIIQKVYNDDLVKQLSGVGSEEGGNAAFIAAAGVADGVGGCGDGGDGGKMSKAQERIVGFSMEFFEFWMRLATKTRSFVQWRFVVEEVLRLSTPVPSDSSFLLPDDEAAPLGGKTGQQTTTVRPPRLRITSSFIVLARLTAMKVLRGRWRRWAYRRNGRKSSTLKEADWLMAQLEDRMGEGTPDWEAGREGRRGRGEGRGLFLSRRPRRP